MIQATVDRIEGEILVLETKSHIIFHLPVSFAPDLKEGDTIRISIEKDDREEADRSEEITSIRSGLNRVELH